MDKSISSEPRLRYRNVSFAYRGARSLALSELDFSLHAGEFVGIVGPSGAGKSTFVRCASGIVPKFFKGSYSGEVLVDGESIAGKRVADLAGRVGVLFQDFESQLFSTNVRLECAFGMENLGVDRETMKARIERIAGLTGISRLMEREPQSLSGGQKQRLALASILCLNPGILLCDEPTTDLDPEGRRDILTVLQRLRESGHSIALVEHDTERLLGADAIIVLRNGRIAAEGTPRAVLGNPDFCMNSSISAPQLYSLFAKLGLSERPASVEEAMEILEREGFTASESPTPLSSNGFGPTENPGGPACSTPLISVEDLHFSYVPGEPVLNGVSLMLGPGEFVAVLGSNGSGKTTLVKHLNALLRVQKGRILFRGKPVGEIGVAGMGRRVGFVFQNPDHMLFAAKARDEIAFGLGNFGITGGAVWARVEEALEAVGLSGCEDADPFTMTKGERQKLAVACVLACGPEVLVLDEPTTGLDAAEQLKMMELLDKLNHAGHTIVIITHSMDVAARYARRTILMQSGRIVADDSTRKIFARHDLLARAGLEAPPCVRLGERLGVPVLSVDEMASRLKRSARI